jgi:hypothetical protein
MGSLEGLTVDGWELTVSSGGLYVVCAWYRLTKNSQPLKKARQI